MSTDREFAQSLQLGFYQPGVPAVERQQAQVLAHRHVMDESRVRRIADVLPTSMAGAQQWLSQINKAQRAPTGGNPAGRTGATRDPLFFWSEVPGTLSKRFKAPGALLREMRAQDPLLQAILMHFTNRLKSFARWVPPSRQAVLGQPEGFDFVREGRSEWERLSDAEEAERASHVAFVLNSGDRERFVDKGLNREDLGRDALERFIAKFVDERYVIDGIPIELERTRNGRELSGYYIVDGDTVYRTAYPDWPWAERGDDRAWVDDKIPEDAAFVQVIHREVVAPWSTNEMLYHVSNPRADIRFAGYGISETEMSARLTTGILNVITHSNSMFDRNALPEGILHISGTLNDDGIEQWKDEWDTYRLAPSGSMGLPTIALRDPNAKLGFLQIGRGAKDMEFQAYTSFLFAIRCAVFGLDVSELNASAFGGHNSSLSSGKDTKAKLDESRSRGFIPLANTFESVMNTLLLPRTRGAWRLTLRGLRKQDSEVLWEAFRETHVVDEVRGLFGSDPLGGMIGNSLAHNPAIAQMSANAIVQAVDVGGQLGEEMDGKNDHLEKKPEKKLSPAGESDKKPERKG